MLNVDHLTAYYDDLIALKDISITVKEGEIVAVIGANGSGKTTLLRSIIGLHTQKDGSITFNNELIKDLPSYKIVSMGIAYVMSEQALFPELTVEQNLRVGVITINKKEEIKKAFENVYSLFPILYQRKNQIAQSLSGGEQKMLAIAKALMMNPSLLLLDEPSLGLAPVIVSKVMEKLLEINKEGVALLLVDQNVQQALRISKHAYVLENGKIVKHGESSSLINDPLVKKAYLGR
ncbi:MAG: ABC transporter ATP-binding protein [Deltaproteobacteria bacterium]|nr:ABC transporter ATP-binding protein [Deltaproteobacteria bacterium]